MTYLLSRVSLKGTILWCLEQMKTGHHKAYMVRNDYYWKGRTYEISIAIRIK